MRRKTTDLIDRQAAIDAVCSACTVATPKTCSTIQNGDMWCKEVYTLLNLPSAEPAIPLQWIETQIEWLKSLDNSFSTLTAVQISAMVNKWKDEQDG